jgi:hypothetical protein
MRRSRRAPGRGTGPRQWSSGSSTKWTRVASDSVTGSVTCDSDRVPPNAANPASAPALELAERVPVGHGSSAPIFRLEMYW